MPNGKLEAVLAEFEQKNQPISEIKFLRDGLGI